ncbi:MAG: hypothetical protein COB09_19130 [Thalassobium sp.]|nr:MAG: hypothetical protein COB09_19130 [Thalassobium sp.]
MRYLNKIDTSAHQNFFLTGISGERINMVLRYMPTQEKWFMDIQWNTFELFGLCVVNSPNLLRKWRNIIPFGISCNSIDGLDPKFIDAFLTQDSSLYLLDEADVIGIEELVFA